MSWALRHQRAMRRVGNRLGNRHTFVWFRPHRLKVARAVPKTLDVKVAALAGVSTLTLFAGTGLALEGDVYSGLVLTIAGTDYSLTADTSAAGSALVVAFSPVLAADVLADDEVTVAPNVILTDRLDSEALWGLKEELDITRIEDYSSRAFTWRIPVNSAPLSPRSGHRIEIPSLGFEGIVREIFDETVGVYPTVVAAA